MHLCHSLGIAIQYSIAQWPTNQAHDNRYQLPSTSGVASHQRLTYVIFLAMPLTRQDFSLIVLPCAYRYMVKLRPLVEEQQNMLA
jgi:hypothetical protein